jgi:RimJ/RimL family protein N-acetyltransferase
MVGFPHDDVIARGRKTVVRRKRMSDATDEYVWRSDAELARFDASTPVRATFVDYERNWSFDMRFTDVAGRSFAVEDGLGRHIGNVMYYNHDSSRGEAELGISIGKRECWGQGYGSDAVASMLSYLFRETDMRRIYLHTLEWNERALRCFERAGFVRCGTSWRNSSVFVVMEVRREWLERPQERDVAAAEVSGA